MKLEFIDITSDSLLNYVRTKAEIQNIPVFRFYTLHMYGIPVDNLIPLQDTIKYLSESRFMEDETDYYNKFVSMYTDQLLNFKPSFIDFMRILSVIQNVPEVIILSNYTHPLVMPIIETMIGIIKDRYSLNSFIVNDIDDIDELSYSEFESDIGYSNYVLDVERYYSYTGGIQNAI